MCFPQTFSCPFHFFLKRNHQLEIQSMMLHHFFQKSSISIQNDKKPVPIEHIAPQSTGPPHPGRPERDLWDFWPNLLDLWKWWHFLQACPLPWPFTKEWDGTAFYKVYDGNGNLQFLCVFLFDACIYGWFEIRCFVCCIYCFSLSFVFCICCFCFYSFVCICIYTRSTIFKVLLRSETEVRMKTSPGASEAG